MKTLRNLFALALVMLCAVNVSAGKKVLLSANFDDGNLVFVGWGNNQTRDVVDGAFHVNNPSAVNSWESQIAYDFNDPFLPNNEYILTMKIKGSAPGLITFGLQNAENSYASVGEFGTIDFDVDWVDVRVKCLCNGEGGKRFIASIGDFEGDIYIDDLELSVWTDQEEVEDGSDPNLRWVNVLANSDLEGEDLSAFWKTENNPDVVDPLEAVINAPIEAEIGKDGSRGIKVSSFSSANGNGITDSWAAQFFIAVPEQLYEGTSYKVKFDYRASQEQTAETQAHKNPGNYNHYAMIGNPAFTTDWQTYEASGKLDGNQANGYFQSVAFNLHINKDEQVDYYFDNIYFYVQNNDLLPQCSGEVVLMHMARPNNISTLVAAGGKKRLILPEGIVTVTINGEPVEVYSAEIYADGRFYAFIDAEFCDDDDVQVTFTNSADPAYQIIYTDDNTVVPDYHGKGYYNERVSEVDGAIPCEFAAPEVMTINPGANAFNLPVSFNTINITFDKAVCCDDLKAYLGSEGLAVEPATGYAEQVKLTRTSTEDLAEGEYEVLIEDIHSEIGAELDKSFWGTVRYTISIGHDIDDNEFVQELLIVLQNAIAKREANSDEVYSGTVLDNLKAAIDKVKADYKTWTSPNAFKNAQKELNGLMVEMDAHHTLVDNYYAAIIGAISTVEKYINSKFANMEEFTALQKGVADFVNELGEIKKVYDDAELQAAVDAIKPIVDSADKYFTEGPSKYGTTGVAALVERFRLGAEALMDLGVSKEDKLVKMALNALTDDDNLAEALKLRLKAELYKALSEGKSLFEIIYDETLEDFVPSTVDMTVFYKNPNIYISNTEVGGGLGEGAYNAEYMPGWTVPEGAAAPKYSVGNYNSAAPHRIVDGTFLQWQGSYQVEQAVVDLPVGVYAIKSSFSERVGSDMSSFFYVKTSDIAEGEYSAVDYVENKGDRPVNDLNLSVNDITVTDGYLNVGVLAGSASCTHFNAISVEMIGTVEYFDYYTAYQEAQAEYDAFMVTFEDGNIEDKPVVSSDKFVVSDASVFTGSSFTFPVSMTNENSITAFQCDIYLSNGLSLNWNDEGEYDVVLNAARKTSSHSVAVSQQPDGAYRVVVYSSGNKLFRGNEGELFTLNLTALDGCAENQEVEIRNIRLSTSDQQEYLLNNVKASVTVKSYTPADANGDGQVTIVDVVAVVNALMGITSGNFVFDAADMDQNGEITIVDVVAVVNVLMGNNVQAYGARSILRGDIHVADAEVKAGETITLYVELDNAQAYTALQMDVELPEGLSIEGVEMVGNSSHAVTCNEDGRIAAYSLNNSRFNGGKSLMGITVKADEGFAGTARVDFTNVRVVSMDVVETTLADAYSTVIGGATDIDDVLSDESVQVIYYTTDGIASDAPHKGLNIIKRIYGDGRVEVSKEMFE